MANGTIPPMQNEPNQAAIDDEQARILREAAEARRNASQQTDQSKEAG